MREKGHIAAKIAHVAGRQFGHITRQQLLDLGMAVRTITRWVDSRRLVRVHTGVYAVGHQQQTAIAKAMAAVLACGDQAILSHDSAAALWGVRTWPSSPEVTAPHDRRRAGIRTHRTITLTRRDIRRHRNIRVTSPSRTILDIQDRLTDSQLARAISDLRLQKHLKATELERLLANSARIRNLIDPTQNPTRSELEDRFIAFCREYGLPRPKTNVTLWGFEIDALFEAEKVIVEIDGWDYHQDRHSFESDRERDRIAAEHGYLTVRLTWTRLTADEAAQLHRILELRRREAA
ncbi:MAG TPA: type IV toxin-antitoxin system AbiEi family antitoxin domain-containing protein [Solirubrobacteraceae bacterium]